MIFKKYGWHISQRTFKGIQFEEKYENVLNEDNADDIINKLID